MLIEVSDPRQVRNDRGFTWSTQNLEPGTNADQKDSWVRMENSVILGYIPQVSHTYALIEGEHTNYSCKRGSIHSLF